MPKGIYNRSEELRRRIVNNLGTRMLGKKMSESNRLRMIERMKGKKYGLGHKVTEENKRKLRELKTGVPRSDEVKEKIRQKLKGRKLSEEHRLKVIKTLYPYYSNQRGENNPSWVDGKSKNPYPKEFTPSLKLKIRTRDNFICCLCDRTEREELEELNRVLCVNHKNFDKNDCREENLNTLCIRCNVKINRDREYWINYFNK